MGFFNLVDNFFLLSVLIVVALLIFLIYHFKSRIALAEQKTDTLFRLMTIVTQKVSSLFDSSPPGLASPDPQTSFAFTTTTPPPVQPVVPKGEVIVLGLSPLSVKERILVSDDEGSDDDDDEGSDDDRSDEEGSEESDEDSASETYDIDETCKIDPEDVNEIAEIQDFEDTQGPLEITFSDIPLHAEEIHAEEITMEAEDFDTPDVVPDAGEVPVEPVVEAMEGAENNQPLLHEGEAFVINASTEADPPVPNVAAESVSPQPTASPYTADQLKKMNINQLKTMALQQGVCTDTSKIKKNELIQLLLAKGL